MPRSKQYGVRVYRRDGSTFVLGPFGSRAEAADSRPTGATVISSRVFRFQEDVSGPPRIVKEQRIVTRTADKFTVVGVNAPGDDGEIRMTGTGFSTLERWVVYYDSGNQSVEFTPPYETDTDVQVVATDAALEGETVTKVELHDGEGLQLTVDGLSVVIPPVVELTSYELAPEPYEDAIFVNGTGLDEAESLVVYWDNDNQSTSFWPINLVDSDTAVCGTSQFEGQTISKVEAYADFPPTELLDSVTGSVLVPAPAAPTISAVSEVGFPVVQIDGTDLDQVDYFMFEANGRFVGFNLREVDFPASFLSVTPTQVVISYQDFAGCELDTLTLGDENQVPISPAFPISGVVWQHGDSVTSDAPGQFTVHGNKLGEVTRLIVHYDGGASQTEYNPFYDSTDNDTFITNGGLPEGTEITAVELLDNSNNGPTLNTTVSVQSSPAPAGFTLTSGYGFSQDRGGTSVVHDNDLDRWVVAADVDDGSGNLTPALWRFSEDGAIDTGFGITDNGLTRIPSTPHSEAVGVGFVPADGSYILVYNDGFNTGTKTLKAVKIQGLAGAIDTSWGVGGFVTLQANAYGVRGGVHIEPDGSIVAAWNDYPGVAAPGRVYRWDADGVLQDQVSITEGPIRGFTHNGNFASGQYAVAVRDPGTGDFWAAKVDLDTQTYDISNIPSDHIEWGAAAFVSVAVDDDGRVYIAAPSAASSTTLRVIRFLSDMTYEGIFQDATDGGIAQMYMVDGLVYDLDGDQGLMAVGTLIPNSGPIQWVFFRFEEGGAQTTFDYYTLGTGGPDWAYAARHDGSGKIIVVGSVDGDAVIARVDDTTGALDPTFG